MKQWRFPLYFYVFFCLCLCVPSISHAVTTTKKIKLAPLEVSGWVPYWRTATATADVSAHLDQLTEINPFGYSVRSDGTLYNAAQVTVEPWTSLTAEAQAMHIRVIPTFMWSNQSAIHQILSHTKSRIALENTIVKAVVSNGFNGADIDFENKSADDRLYFATFLKGLHQRLGSKWLMCDIEARTPVSQRYLGTPPAD